MKKYLLLFLAPGLSSDGGKGEKEEGKRVRDQEGNPSPCKVRPTVVNTDGQTPGISSNPGDAQGSHGAKRSLIIIQRNENYVGKMGAPEA